MNNDPANLTLHQRLKFLLKDSVLYGGAASFNKAFALLTFPILARHFSVAQYGVYDFINVSIYLLSIIFVFGQDSAVARFYYEHDDAPTRRRIISQSFALQFGRLFVFLVPLWFFAGQIASLYGGEGVDEGLVKLMLLQVPFMGLINFAQNILKWTFSRAKFLTVSMGSTVCSMTTLIVALIFFDLGLREVFSIFLASRTVFGLLGLWFCRQWLIWPKDWEFIWPTLKFALPYGVICTVAAFIPALERTFIIEFLSERDLGLFAAGTKIAMLMSLPVQAFQVAWGPFSLAIHKEGDSHATYSQVLRSFALGVVVLTILLTVIAEPVIRLLASSQYAGASIVVFPIAMGLAIEGLSYIVTVGISISKKTYLNLVSYAIYLLVSLLAIYGFICNFGLIGVAWGAMLGRAAKAVAESWLSHRVYPVAWGFRKMAIYLGIALLWGCGGQFITMHEGFMNGSMFNGLGLIILLPFGLFVLFSKEEREQIGAWIKKRLGKMGYSGLI